VHPTLVKIPLFGMDITIYAYGTVIVLSFLLAAWWAKRRAGKTLGLPEDRVFNVAFAILFIGLAGARFVYALANYAEFARRPLSLCAIWGGGLVGYGGLVASLLWLAWWMPKKAEKGQFLEGKAWPLLDILARGACLAFALGWFASLLAGDDYGKPTTAPWGIPALWFADGTPASLHAVQARGDLLGLKLHPSQVYESLLGLGLFALLALLSRRRLAPGRVAAAFLMLHALGHGLLDTLRGDADKRGMVVGDFLSWSQFLAIPVFFAGLALWLIRKPERPGARPRA